MAPFLFSLTVTSIAVLLDRIIQSDFHNSLVLFLYPAGFFSVWFGGAAGGLFSVFLGTIAGYLSLVYPSSGGVHSPTVGCLIDLGLYSFFGIIFGILISREKNTKKTIQEALRALKHTALKLSEREKELSCAVRARDDFFSIASHELKTPITALKLQIQIFERQIKKQADSKFKASFLETAHAIEEQISRLTNLVESLLDVTRIAQGSLKLELSHIDVAELAKDMALRYSNILSASACEVRIRQKGTAFLKCDRMRMEQVFTNLLANSAKYAPRAPIDIFISREAEELKITFKDSGLGISPSQIKHIFAPFKRLEHLSKVNSGMGLGLFIVKQVIEAHGGQIECESELGKGVSFVMSLPLDAASSPGFSFSMDSVSEETVNFFHRRFAASFAD